MTDDTPSTPSSNSSGCALPNPACLECRKITWTVPIYLDSPVSLSQIRIADLHPICSKCQTSKVYKGRHKFCRPLKDETVRALVEKYDVDDYKGVLWECAMLLSGFREPVEDEENGLIVTRSSNVARRKSDDKGRRNPRKSAGIDRQVREAKEELERKRNSENLQRMETKERLAKDGVGVGGTGNDESQKENHVMRHFENHDDGNFWDRIRFEDGGKPSWAAEVAFE